MTHPSYESQLLQALEVITAGNVEVTIKRDGSRMKVLVKYADESVGVHTQDSLKHALERMARHCTTVFDK